MAVIDEVVALCRRLRLKYVREQVSEVLLTARAQRWDPAELLRVLLVAEAEGRDRSTIETKRRKGALPRRQDLRVPGSRRARRSRPPPSGPCAASSGSARAENLVVAGPQGTGKSHLLEALGHHAVDQGLTVAWFSVEDLGAIVRRHRVDDTVSKTFAALAAMLADRGRRHRLAADLQRCRRRPLPPRRRRLRAALAGPVVQPAPLGLRPAHGQDHRLGPGRPAHAPRPRHRHRRRVGAPGRRPLRQGGGAPRADELGRNVAVRGEFSWPSLGRSSGRPRGLFVAVRWGIPMAACGEIAMAVDRRAHDRIRGLARSRPSTPRPGPRSSTPPTARPRWPSAHTRAAA